LQFDSNCATLPLATAGRGQFGKGPMMERVSGDAGYPGAGKRPENEGRQIDWKIAMRRGKRNAPGKGGPEEAEGRRKASVRARVEHPFRWLKHCFKYSKVRYRGLYKNRQRMAARPDVANLTMAGRHAAA